jgi:SAM-dependent methyltransferase
VTTISPAVMWHDVECGGYTADLPLWSDLAGATPAAVLDVGAGTGRVALHLAGAGHAVTALDRDAELLAVLAERARAAALEIATVTADAERFDVGARRFDLIAVPMQMLQLLPDAAARGRFFAAARGVLAPGGRVAAALATALEAFEGASLPLPDVGEHDGRRFVSQPVAVREDADAAWIERVRLTIAPDGVRTSEPDVVRLARVSAAGLAAEAAANGLAVEEVRAIPATDEHVGSEVVVLRG